MTDLRYDYSKAKEAGDAVGLIWREDMVAWVDEGFSKLHLTQEQADGVLSMYATALQHFMENGVGAPAPKTDAR